MKKQIVINASQDRSRIAIVEDGDLVELYVENPDNVRTIGNVYLGKVKKVMPTLRAAFVDIGHTTPAGEKQDAFLHFSDLTENFPQLLKMAGEDVPGLDDAPVLALAPQKRIADDASEPDVEDTLELAEPEADAEPARARSTRSRRSRGRGGRRRGEGRAHEEEEQEEDARPRRAVAVIDLTSRPKPAAPARTPRTPTPEAPSESAAPAPVAAAPAEDAADAPADDAPSRRPRRRTRGAAAAPATEDAAEPTTAEPTSDAPTAVEPAPDAPAPDEPTVDVPAAAAHAEPAPSGRPPRRKPRARGAAAPTAEAPTPAPSPEPETLEETAPEPVAEVAPVAAPEAAMETTPDGRPPRRTRRRTRGEADETTPADAPVPTPAPTSAPTPAEAAPASHTEVPAPAPPRPRGTLTIDLTAPARPPRPAAPTADTAAPAGPPTPTASDDDEPSEGRSRRRRSRGSRSGDAAPETLAETPHAEAEPSEAAAEPDARSRRRTRGADDDARAPREADAAPAPERSDRSSSDRASSSRDAGDRGRGSNGRAAEPARAPGRKPVPIPPNEQLLRTGGQVIVKVTKEPISSKGSRVSTDISLAGRFLVLVPAADYVAVSKKIESAKERRRLRTLAEGLKPANCGVIVRTVAEGQDAKSLDADLRLLVRKWNDIEARLDGGRAKAPLLLYEDLNMVSSIIRDLFSDDFDRILVDDPTLHKTVQAYVRAVAPHMADRVELHRSNTPVFRAVGIESQVEGAFSKRVPLKSGGYLFIETTEAMHVVDVNSGRAGRGKSQKENMIAVNVEAAREIAKQLRLRDLGGIIVVDFIDLKMDADRRKVTNALKDAFEKDRAVTKLLPMSDFGVVQITRQRLRPSITTQADDDDDDVRDPAVLAARAGAGEIEQAPRRGGRDLDAPEPEARPAADRDERGGRARRRDTDDRRDDDRRSDDRRSDDRREPRRDETPSAPEATPEALARGLRRWLDHYKATVDERHRDRPVTVRVHPLFAAHLRRGFPSLVTRWRFSVRGFPWQIAEDAAVDPLAFDVRDDKSGRSLTRKYAPEP